MTNNTVKILREALEYYSNPEPWVTCEIMRDSHGKQYNTPPIIFLDMGETATKALAATSSHDSLDLNDEALIEAVARAIADTGPFHQESNHWERSRDKACAAIRTLKQYEYSGTEVKK